MRAGFCTRGSDTTGEKPRRTSQAGAGQVLGRHARREIEGLQRHRLAATKAHAERPAHARLQQRRELCVGHRQRRAQAGHGAAAAAIALRRQHLDRKDVVDTLRAHAHKELPLVRRQVRHAGQQHVLRAPGPVCGCG